MDKALVISLNFNPGHVSHLIASYRQLEELGYESQLFVDAAFIPFLPKNCRYCVYGKDKIPQVSVAIVLFPSQKNLFLSRASSMNRCFRPPVMRKSENNDR